ncbi:BatD family protein [Flavobacterium sp. 3HN19-14]|uniref:BatD family protein n=1 Tax=Flavobacterium sp. 3HN19-14 TaxID=3448133 RepID=UPI003EE136C7
MGLNERLRVDFSMNDDGDNFIPPNFEGFKVVGRPGQQISQSWVNGRSSFNKIYTYFLMPMQKGNLVIRQAFIEIRGQVYKTSPVKITVTNAIQLPKDPNDVQANIDDAIHLVADVSKANPYINEPITVVYKLYFGNVNITNWRELDKPKYNDFWSQNIDIKQLQVEEGTFNGERFHYVVLRKTVLYPQKSGKLVIEPLSLDIDLQIPTNRRNIFGQYLLTEGNKRVSAGAKSINVRALPEFGKPIDFSGAVGKFSFKVTPTKTTLKNGESLDLNISVSGTGNLKLFNLPKPIVPNSLEMYDPVHSEKVNTPLSGMNGSITDKYTIIPQYKGDYPIKGLTFSYFDLGFGSYKTITSPDIIVKVLDGPTAGSGEVAETGVAKHTLSKNDHFQFIKLKTHLQAIHKKDFFGSTLFWTLSFLPLAFIPLIVIFRKKKKRSTAMLPAIKSGNRINSPKNSFRKRKNTSITKNCSTSHSKKPCTISFALSCTSKLRK